MSEGTFGWTLPAELEQLLRERLALVAPTLRAELWWWMAQRDRTPPEPRPDDFTDLDPDADRIIDHIGVQPDARVARADEHLAYLLLIDQTPDMPNAAAYKAIDPKEPPSPLTMALDGLEDVFNAHPESPLAQAVWRACKT